MADSTFQVTGISSGIDWGSIIDKIIEKEKKPATLLQNKVDTLTLKKSLYSELSSAFFKVRNTLTSLRLESTYLTKQAEFTVTSGGGKEASAIIKATPKSNAEISRWNIEVEQIAKAQKHVSSRYEGSEQLNMEGTFSIQVGEQYTLITIEKDDSIRTINQKVGSAKDQFGQKMALTAKLVDNHLVIESGLTGLDTNQGKATTGKSGEKLTLGSNTALKTRTVTMSTSGNGEISLPASTGGDGKYPVQVANIEAGNTTYALGVDFAYDPAEGSITWISTGQKPADGTSLKINYYDSSTTHLPVIETVVNSDGKTTQKYPPQIISIKQDANYFMEGRDFSYDGNGTITWLATGNRPTPDKEFELLYTATMTSDMTTTGTYELPLLPSGAQYNTSNITLRKSDGTPLTDAELTAAGTFSLSLDPDGGQSIVFDDPAAAYAVLGNQMTVTVGNAAQYKTHYSKMYIKDVSGTVAQDIGLFNNVTEAQDAKLKIDGVSITRSTNEIEDLVANVKLELVGEGSVIMDITQDAQKAVEGVQAFVDAYNELMLWINEYSSEKVDPSKDNNQDGVIDDKDTLFGLLHGDPLLWSIKSQLRMLQMNPIAVAPNAVMTKKYLFTNEALTLNGSFYITTGGLRTRIDVKNTDSLEDIKTKIEEATDMSNGGTGTTATKKKLPISVAIVDGQLIIDTTSVKTDTQVIPHTVIHNNSGNNFDYLPFVYDETAPVNSKVAITGGGKVYTQGVDFDIVNEETDKGVILSKIVWHTSSSKQPKGNESLSVNHAYNESAISISPIAGSGDLSTLDFHNDSSKAQLFSVGIQSEGHSTSGDYGKSGYLEFDTDKMMSALTNDPKQTAGMLVAFMKQMDSFIGNMVDSGGKVVGSEIVTKGRVAGSVQALENEITGLSKRIADIEKRLADRQTSLYKRYTDMELAMSKMNAQLSSMTKYFNSQSGTAQ